MDVEEVQVEGELKVWLFMLFSPYFLYVTFQPEKFFNKFNDGVHDKFHLSSLLLFSLGSVMFAKVPPNSSKPAHCIKTQQK